MGKKILIIGGVAGGATAAARMRRLDENAQIIMFERDEYISFANCGLPYHIGETIKERDQLILETPEKMNQKFNLDVRVHSEVIAIDTENKKVTVKSADKGEYEETYDYLILSPGAKPIQPPLPGIDGPGIYKLRNIADMDRIKDVVDNKNPQDAVVIGGGFIGLETAENLKERGMAVTIVEAAPHILAPFDTEMAVIAEKELNDNGVSIILGNGVSSFEKKDEKVSVTLGNGRVLETDMVILSIGVSPDTGFLKGSGINLGERGHILVDETMRTNVEGVYAVGDAILVKDYVFQTDAAIPLAGPANRQARIAADNIAGLNKKYKGTQGTSILKLFEMNAASTGNNERNLQRMGMVYNKDYKVSYIHPMNHASYYPGATPLTIKAIYDMEGKVLGSQVIGYEGVDKFVDVMATAIKFGATVYDLQELELAYAPPFLSAKSPANMVGFMAENELTGLVENFRSSDLANFDPDKHLLLDIRDSLEVETSPSIDQSIHIPLNELRHRLAELDKNKEIWTYCAIGVRGYIAARILQQNGFKVKNLLGGLKTYNMGKYEAKEVEASSHNKSDGCPLNENPPEIQGANTVEVDACGLCCPGPLMRAKNTMDLLKPGEIMNIKASDPGFFEDVKAFAKSTGNQLLQVKKDKGIIYASVKKGNPVPETVGAIETSNPKNGQTMVVFSGDLDKAIASFIIANGAASMGKKVTMFFTFWGLNILRREEPVAVKKSLIEKGFGMMMPRGSKKLQLSKMKMGGIGTRLMKKVMRDKNVESLESLIEAAQKSGVNMVACTMSMDVMGIKEEELISGINLGGVGYYLGEAEEANVNLFV